MFQPLGQDAQRQRLGARHRFFARRAIRYHARQLRNLSDPPTVGLLFDLDFEHDPSISYFRPGIKTRIAWLTWVVCIASNPVRRLRVNFHAANH